MNLSFSKIFLTLIITSLLGIISCDPPIGGPCEYESEKGYIKVVGFGDSTNLDIEMVFNFYSDRSRRVDGIYIDKTCAASIKAGDSLPCIRMVCTKGSCDPIMYEFDSTTCVKQK